MWVNQGRSPKGVQTGTGRMPSVQRGAAEGAKLEDRDAWQGTRREARQMVGTMGESAACRRVSHRRARPAGRHDPRRRQDAAQSIDNLETLARAKSPSSLSGTQAQAKGTG